MDYTDKDAVPAESKNKIEVKNHLLNNIGIVVSLAPSCRE